MGTSYAGGKLNYLLSVVQELSLARSMDDIARIVRTAARALTEADGATFVLRDGNSSHYVDEDVLSPLWKGMRFPMETCISGWVMLNRRAAVIKDIYKDSRIPADVYRPTFVKSLAMIPIRAKSPIGAIGNYWATERDISPDEVHLLQALADSTSIAIENVYLYTSLERKVVERTAELEAFTHAVSHDLKAPIRGLIGFSRILEEEHGKSLDAGALNCLHRIQNSATRMSELVDGLLALSHLSNRELVKIRTDLSDIAHRILSDLAAGEPARKVEISVQRGLNAYGDSAMLTAALDNLLRNAWKFSRRTETARIEVGSENGKDGKPVYFVKDNGAGFDPSYSAKLFQVFQRLHSSREFEGTGIGLATVHRIISRHGGRIWANSEPGHGAQFYFDLPNAA
jgi:signal transduction histidine kinase